MLEILTPQNPSVYTYTVDTFLQANLQGEIILPQAIIYLKPPSYEDFLQRVSDRGATLIPLLNDYTSGKVMELWYNRLVSTEFDPSNSRIIAGGKVCENALSLNSFISQANYSIDFSTQNIKNY